MTPHHSRRHFLKILLGAGAMSLSANACRSTDPLAHIEGGMVEPDAATGHLLRNPASIPAPTANETTDVAIVGGGISGLSALRALRAAGMQNVQLLELDAQVGGNSQWGHNAASSYPWAAHYLPIPDPRNTELLAFLEECGCIRGYRNGQPVYDERQLCSEPEERLFINGYWQEGLVPATGLTAAERAQTGRFLAFVDDLRKKSGSDGRELFAIPLKASSNDPEWRALDDLSFSEWLNKEGYTAKPLLWYLDYCCKDDYGAGLAQVSAWAGLHYFASRKGAGANVRHSDLLTWSQGNGFLMEGLRKGREESIRTGQLVYNVQPEGDGVLLSVYDSKRRESRTLRANRVVMATPHFVSSRLLAKTDYGQRGEGLHFQHHPWLVANITLDGLPPPRTGQPLCWDNVIYGAASVGYVNANQQDLNESRQKVITFYKPLLEGDERECRRRAQQRPHRQWLEEIVAELQTAHPDVAASIRRCDVRIWGHGMVAPRPGFLWDGRRERLSAPIDNRIFFAHTDYCGISVFEEAFYAGLTAARQILHNA